MEAVAQVSSSTAKTKRPRASRAACETCHRRKIKCDAVNLGLPCSNCRKSMQPNCYWHQKKRRAVVRSPHDPIPIRPQPDVQPAADDSPQQEVPPSGISPTPTNYSDEIRQEPNGSSQSSEYEHPLMEDGAQGCKRHLVEFIDQEGLCYRPIDKAARITYVGTDVSNINFLVRQSNQGAVVHHFPTNRIDRRFTAHEPNRLPVEAFQLPQKSVVDELLQSYFEKINPGFPVVDEERFMEQYRARDATDPPSLLLMQAILLVGAHVCPGREEMKHDFFRRAKMLIDTRFERNRDVIVQAALLLTWYPDGPEDVGANAWYWIGFAARTAMGLGMHRDAEPSNLVSHNKRMWRRVWWLLVQCDLLIALQYGRPLAIHLDDCDVQPPKPSDYASCGATTQVDYAIAMTELCIILCNVYRRCFGRHSKRVSRHTALAEADELLARWSLLLPQHLRLRPTLTLELWPANLHLIYNTALILLHRPRPQLTEPSSPSSVPNASDADICSAAAGVIQTIFESLCERQSLCCLWTFNVNALFTAMIQLSVEVRFASPLLAIAAVRRYDSTLYSLRQLAKYWPNAESVLHFFEHSERLQRQNIHLEKDLTSPMQFLTSPGRARKDLEGGVLPSPSTASTAGESFLPTASRNTTTDQEPRQEEDSGIEGNRSHDWKVLFPFTGVVEGGSIEGAFLESWQEMYWQEPFNFDGGCAF